MQAMMPDLAISAAPVAVTGLDVPVLEIEDLHVQFATSRGTVRAVEGVSFKVNRGEIVAIVGESGSGKSVSALAIMRLLPAGAARVTARHVRFCGRELLTLSDEEMRAIRGREIAMIFQEPMTSLNPVLNDRRADHGAAADPSQDERPGRPRPGLSSCWGWSASPIPSGASASIPTSSRAACASG